MSQTPQQIVADAARSWLAELHEHIIPGVGADERPDFEAQADELETALDALDFEPTTTTGERLESDTGLSVTIERSANDGTLVVFIDGADGYDAGDDRPGRENAYGPVLRVRLNDEPLYTNPALPGIEPVVDLPADLATAALHTALDQWTDQLGDVCGSEQHAALRTLIAQAEQHAAMVPPRARASKGDR